MVYSDLALRVFHDYFGRTVRFRTIIVVLVVIIGVKIVKVAVVSNASRSIGIVAVKAGYRRGLFVVHCKVFISKNKVV